MTRKFNLIDQEKTNLMPKRATKYSAGYDLRASRYYHIPSQAAMWERFHRQTNDTKKKFVENPSLFLDAYSDALHDNLLDLREELRPVMVSTGVTVEMNPNDYGILANRSSNATKRFMLEPNGIGVIDADYTGELMVPLINFGPTPVKIKPGDRIAQFIFNTYELTDDDVEPETERQGGFGSTGEA